MRKIVYVSVVLLFTACSSSKYVYNELYDNKATSTSLSDIINNNITGSDFDILKAEVIYYDENEGRRFIVSVKSRKDGRYLATIRLNSGIEVSRIFIEDDSVFINDRINRKYMIGKTDWIENNFGINKILLPVIFGDIIYDQKDLNKELDCIGGSAKSNARVESGNVEFDIDCGLRKIRRTGLFSSKSQGNLFFEYDRFAKHEFVSWPRRIRIFEGSEGKILKAEINVKEINFEVSNEISFIPGARYEIIFLR